MRAHCCSFSFSVSLNLCLMIEQIPWFPRTHGRLRNTSSSIPWCPWNISHSLERSTPFSKVKIRGPCLFLSFSGCGLDCWWDGNSSGPSREMSLFCFGLFWFGLVWFYPLHFMEMQPVWGTKQKKFALLGIEIYQSCKKYLILLSPRLAAFPRTYKGSICAHECKER